MREMPQVRPETKSWKGVGGGGGGGESYVKEGVATPYRPLGPMPLREISDAH